MAAGRVITPDSFTVAPQLIGLPLASARRRALAMLIDLFLVALLTQLGAAVLGLAAAFVLWRFSARRSNDGFVKHSVRTAMRIAAAIVVFALVAGYTRRIFDASDNDEDIDRSAENADAGFETGDLELAAGAGSTLTRPQASDSVAQAYAAALGRKDSVAAETLRAALRNAFVGTELTARDRTIAQLRRDVRQLESDAERRERRGGVRAFIGGAADDLGLGFGWMALYFTALLTLMGGQTPGKRALGIRVMRLDAKPITWWIAFERFGGYAASATLGLLGFVQILWDKNRQGLHDKAVETVVTKTR